MKDLEYYLSRTTRVGNCLEWTKALNSDGYPRVVVGDNVNGKAHREVFFLVNGYYPTVVRHRCDNPVCINPEHLEGGSVIDNCDDRHERKRTANYIEESEVELIHKLRSYGLTYREIAIKMGIKRKRVDYVLNWKK